MVSFPNTVKIELLCRSGPISWRLLPSGRAVSVYGDGKGFIVKVGANSSYDYPSLSILKASYSLSIREKLQVHDNLGFKFRSSHYNSAGTVKGDKLCMDASETRVVVGAF